MPIESLVISSHLRSLFFQILLDSRLKWGQKCSIIVHHLDSGPWILNQETVVTAIYVLILG